MVEGHVITRLSTGIMYPLMLSYILLVLALQGHLFLWISLIAILCILWRFMFQINKTTQPTTGVLNLLALVCIGLIAYFSLSEGILNGMANLLMIGTAMKLLAIKTEQGAKQLCLSLYFILAAALIYKQGIGFTSYLVLIFVINTYTLIHIHSPGLQFMQRVRYTGRFFAISIPLVLLIFGLMPRLDPLWKMPSSKGTATGLSEEIKPGDISKLAQSADLAFRVIFDGAVPEQKDLYWRTMVHEQFDGSQWSIEPFRKTPQNIAQLVPIDGQGANSRYADNQIFDYQIIAEPSYQRWLYSLDTPIDYSGPLIYHHDRLLSNTRIAGQKFQYRVKSALRHQLQDQIFNFEKQLNLQLPADSNPKTLDLAKQLRASAIDDMAYVNLVLSYFTEHGFVYTLEPPRLANNPVDGFLFDSKRGFCSHFSSAFAVLMRAGGIPARIVSGYQGGERSEDDDYISLYQYEAHAWNEIWLADRGWLRVDPTAVVSPDRIAFGLQAAMKNDDSFLTHELFDLVKYREFALANWLRQGLNNLDFYWSSWILNFDRKKQAKLLESVWGKQNTLMTGVYVALSFGCLVIVIFLVSRRQHFYHHHSALAQIDQQIRKIGKRYGYQQPQSTPPVSYLQQFAQHAPEQAQLITELTNHYQQCLYQDLSNEQYQAHLQQVKLLIKQLNKQSKKTI